jgi:hypothetical protein
MMVEPSATGALGERLAEPPASQEMMVELSAPGALGERLAEPPASQEMMVELSAPGAPHLHRHRIGNYAFAVNIRMASHRSEGGRRAFLVQPASL